MKAGPAQLGGQVRASQGALLVAEARRQRRAAGDFALAGQRADHLARVLLEPLRAAQRQPAWHRGRIRSRIRGARRRVRRTAGRIGGGAARSAVAGAITVATAIITTAACGRERPHDEHGRPDTTARRA